MSERLLLFELTKPTAYSLCGLQTTTIHRTESSSSPFFGCYLHLAGHFSVFLIDDSAFRFVSEGDRHFCSNQLAFSPHLNPTRATDPKLFCLLPTGNPTHPHRVQVILPNWAWDNIDLKRWILGFDSKVKLVSPDKRVTEFRQLLQQTAALYED